jgi:hypothetical protein
MPGRESWKSGGAHRAFVVPEHLAAAVTILPSLISESMTTKGGGRPDQE